LARDHAPRPRSAVMHPTPHVSSRNRVWQLLWRECSSRVAGRRRPMTDRQSGRANGRAPSSRLARGRQCHGRRVVAGANPSRMGVASAARARFASPLPQESLWALDWRNHTDRATMRPIAGPAVNPDRRAAEPGANEPGEPCRGNSPADRRSASTGGGGALRRLRIRRERTGPYRRRQSRGRSHAGEAMGSAGG
jgi:hypothetical protein